MKPVHNSAERKKFQYWGQRLFFAFLIFLLTGCIDTGIFPVAMVPRLSQTQIMSVDSTDTSLPTLTATPFQPLPTLTTTFTPQPTNTVVPTATPVPTETPVPTATTDPENPHGWQWHEASEPVYAPILLYHHVNPSPNWSPYFITSALFTEQMDWLAANGYTSITATQLAKAIIYGGYLPEKPVVITFDDGYQDVYTVAFPILQERGLIGNFYIVAQFLRETPGGATPEVQGVTIEEAQTMAAAGWEIGSHSMSHANLVFGGSLEYEVGQSRAELADKLDVPISTFCYPYGAAYWRPGLFEAVRDYGYVAGMGLGISNTHTTETIQYLSRVEIPNGTSLEQFIQKVTAP